jgi:hypothetical protein
MGRRMRRADNLRLADTRYVAEPVDDLTLFDHIELPFNGLCYGGCLRNRAKQQDT